jgi:hypothetical protein
MERVSSQASPSSRLLRKEHAGPDPGPGCRNCFLVRPALEHEDGGRRRIGRSPQLRQPPRVVPRLRRPGVARGVPDPTRVPRRNASHHDRRHDRIAGGLPSGVLAALLGPRGVFAAEMVLPVLVIASVVFIPRCRDAPARATQAAEGPLGGGRARLVLLVGLGYAERLRRAAVTAPGADRRDARGGGGRGHGLHLPRDS